MGSPEKRQVGKEIEITPEMIEAGITELFFYERGSDDSDECVAAIYAAMEAARLRTLNGDHLPLGVRPESTE
jgi:hypothetical protein